MFVYKLMRFAFSTKTMYERVRTNDGKFMIYFNFFFARGERYVLQLLGNPCACPMFDSSFFFHHGSICLYFLAGVSCPRIMTFLLARSSHPELLYFYNVASFRRNRNYSPWRWEECRKKNHFERNRNWNFQT